METRELRYFLAVAEELHIGRAAQRLGMAQPPLSRAIQRLERRLGVTLLERTGRGVQLTDAGAVLRDEGRAALDAVHAAERRTRRAAPAPVTSRPAVVLVTKAGASSELLAKLLEAYAAEPDSAEVEVLLCGIGEQESMLRDGQADVALLHRPFDSGVGFDTEDLRSEGQMLLLPAGHPLSSCESLRTADVDAIADPPPARWPTAVGHYPEGPGPQVRDLTQLLQLVALGRAWTMLPESVRADLRSDVVGVPVVDAPTVTTMIAWPPQSRSRALAALVRVATAL
ncbi:LysR family transcriptional regulator [Kineosporia sp. R_H_3]|uniref:LysR family transcriptional regulator n=1 Tax=Kineosporia sp. R_H_3 TaxID=1961848 RepID=UPI000B4AB2E6|nr:LysR family transcriptional regulator [Kineosporia sp. R_H_3]